MNRSNRVAFQVLGPGALGLLGLALRAMIQEMARGRMPAFTLQWQDGLVLVWYLLAACVTTAIPSLVYSLIMESLFRKVVSSASWWAVAISTALGGMVGVAIMLVICWFKLDWDALATFGAVGLAVGFAIGAIVKHWSPKDEPRRPVATT